MADAYPITSPVLLQTAEILGTKRCSGCKQTKSLSSFAAASGNADGLHRECRDCSHVRNVQRRRQDIRRNESRPVDLSVHKRCHQCCLVKPAIDFCRNVGNKDGLASACKACNRLRMAERVRTNIRKNQARPLRPEVLRQCKKCLGNLPETDFYRNATTRDGLSPACRACETEARRLRQTDIVKYLERAARAARTRARKRSLPCDVNAEYLLSLWTSQEGRCAYTGIVMTHQQAPRHSSAYWTNLSVDRTDSTKGYVRGNIQLACIWANVAKGPMAVEAFRSFVAMAAGQIPSLVV